MPGEPLSVKQKKKIRPEQGKRKAARKQKQLDEHVVKKITSIDYENEDPWGGRLFDRYYVFFTQLLQDQNLRNTRLGRYAGIIVKGVDTHYKSHLLDTDFDKQESQIKVLFQEYANILQKLIINERIAEQKWAAKFLEYLTKIKQVKIDDDPMLKHLQVALDNLNQHLQNPATRGYSQSDYEDLILGLNNYTQDINEYQKDLYNVRKKMEHQQKVIDTASAAGLTRTDAEGNVIKTDFETLYTFMRSQMYDSIEEALQKVGSQDVLGSIYSENIEKIAQLINEQLRLIFNNDKIIPAVRAYFGNAMNGDDEHDSALLWDLLIQQIQNDPHHAPIVYDPTTHNVTISLPLNRRTDTINLFENIGQIYKEKFKKAFDQSYQSKRIARNLADLLLETVSQNVMQFEQFNRKQFKAGAQQDFINDLFDNLFSANTSAQSRDMLEGRLRQALANYLNAPENIYNKKATENKKRSGYKSTITNTLKVLIEGYLQQTKQTLQNQFNDLWDKSESDILQYYSGRLPQISQQALTDFVNKLIVDYIHANIKIAVEQKPNQVAETMVLQGMQKVGDILSQNGQMSALEHAFYPGDKNPKVDAIYSFNDSANVIKQVQAFFKKYPPKSQKGKSPISDAFIISALKSIDNLWLDFIKDVARTSTSQRSVGENFTTYITKQSNAATAINTIIKEIDKTTADQAEQNKILQEILDYINNLLTVEASVKEYNVYYNEIGYEGGSLGGEGRVIEAVPNILNNYIAAGGKHNYSFVVNAHGENLMSGHNANFQQLLIDVLLNSGDAMIAGRKYPDLINKVKTFLLGAAAMTMFDEGFANTQLVFENFQEALFEGTSLSGTKIAPSVAHFYFVNELFIPQSYILSTILQSVENAFLKTINTFNDMISTNNIIVHNDIQYDRSGAAWSDDPKEQKQGIGRDGLTKQQRWEYYSELAQQKVTMKFVFLGNMLDIFRNLEAKLQNPLS